MNLMKGSHKTGSLRLYPIFSFCFYHLLLVFFIFPSTLHAQSKIPASPYGGQRQLKDFIKQEMVYPANAKNDKIQGEVIISVYVSETGEVKYLKIIESVNSELDAESLRILNKILWFPAAYMGDDYDDVVSVIIKFNIKKYERNCKDRGYTEIVYPRPPVDESNKIYNYNAVDTIPRILFDDPNMSLAKFINDNIEYPEAALEHGVSGTEIIEFIVEPSGRLSNVHPTVHVGAGCCEEAVRLIKLLKWYPGIKDDTSVRTKMGIQITFNLTDDNQIRFVPTYMSGAMQ